MGIIINGQTDTISAADGGMRLPSAIETDITLSQVPFIENTQTISSDYTVPGTYNASTIGPITINNNITVTITSGGSWVIL